ncbi:hypothetical protein ABT127_25835 [Streptomyces sp. NPDC001904]|uniref:hypothetical protein n=1 Tax=Streptomyces sp. NPDC001904 TaxID=3154531 RepID=UPI0033325FFC
MHDTAPPRTPHDTRRRARGARTGRPALTLVPGSDAHRTVELSALTAEPMPADVRGALVRPTGGALVADWLPLGRATAVPEGRVLLSWTPVGPDRTDVTAHLGHADGVELLAVWPGLRGEWSSVVRPTVIQVTGLYATLHAARRSTFV